jgi:hypothetical protein
MSEHDWLQPLRDCAEKTRRETEAIRVKTEVIRAEVRQLQAEVELLRQRKRSLTLERLLAPAIPRAIPAAEWHEDDGEVLWWRFPIEEAPYVGSPLCNDWPGHHTHFTQIVCPKEP